MLSRVYIPSMVLLLIDLACSVGVNEGFKYVERALEREYAGRSV
jgi:hypothetical protein